MVEHMTTTRTARPTQVHLYLVTDGKGVVRGASLVGFSVTGDLLAWKDSLLASINAGTFDESQIPDEIDGTWIFVVKG
jgi:hypothetical protein